MTNQLATIGQLYQSATLTAGQAANRAAAWAFLDYRGRKSPNTLRNHRATLNNA